MTRIDNLETLLSSDDTNGSIIELDNFIGELWSYGGDMDNPTFNFKTMTIDKRPDNFATADILIYLTLK